MYNEIAGREFARNRMREAQQEVQNAKLLASLEEDAFEADGQSAASRLGLSIQHVLQIFSLRGGLAGSE
jgi:hypothetical protein